MKSVEPGAAVNDPPAAFGIEKVWDADGTMLAKLSDRPINLGVPDDTAPPPDPTAAAGGGRGGNQNQTGRRELAWRADGQVVSVAR